MCLWAIYIFPGSVHIFPPAEKADPSWKYIIRSQAHECGNWDWGPIFLFWEYLFQILGILSLQCSHSNWSRHSRRSSFPVISAFRSFRLSGCHSNYNFPVVPVLQVIPCYSNIWRRINGAANSLHRIAYSTGHRLLITLYQKKTETFLFKLANKWKMKRKSITILREQYLSFAISRPPNFLISPYL